MSSTTGTNQRPLGAYYTPDDVAQRCVSVIASDIAGRPCLEPSSGGGSFMRAMILAGATVEGWDVDPSAPTVLDGSAECHDFMGPARIGDLYRVRGGVVCSRWDWIVGNPPYNEAQAHVERAICFADVGCAFLLRLAFLEGQLRSDFWAIRPPAEVHVLRQRPAFLERHDDGQIGPLRKRDKDGALVLNRDGSVKLAGTDSAAYAFFVWRRSFTGSPVLGWI